MSLTRHTLTLVAAYFWCSCARGSAERPEHRPPVTCVSRCSNVREIPVCAALPEDLHTVSEILSAPLAWNGKRVTVSGVLEKGRGIWSEINCPCCSVQLDARVELRDPASSGALVLSGIARTRDGTQALMCSAREGYMIESVVSGKSAAAFTYERDAGVSRDTALPLQPAYCCSISVHGRRVIATGTLRAPLEAPGATLLVDPSLCELSRR